TFLCLPLLLGTLLICTFLCLSLLINALLICTFLCLSLLLLGALLCLSPAVVASRIILSTRLRSRRGLRTLGRGISAVTVRVAPTLGSRFAGCRYHQQTGKNRRESDLFQIP